MDCRRDQAAVAEDRQQDVDPHEDGDEDQCRVGVAAPTRRQHESDRGSDHPVDGARGADQDHDDGADGQGQGDGAGGGAEEEDGQEPDPAQEPLDDGAEGQQQADVDQEVQQVGVEERVADQGHQSARRDAGPRVEEHGVEEQRDEGEALDRPVLAVLRQQPIEAVAGDQDAAQPQRSRRRVEDALARRVGVGGRRPPQVSVHPLQSSRLPISPARSWMNCQATRPERAPRVTDHSLARARRRSAGRSSR